MHREQESDSRRPRRTRRSGSVLIWCALLLPVLVAMVGLTVDGGLMLAAYREAQNAADAAATAAAYDLMIGKTVGTAKATAATFVTDASHNNLSAATVTVNIPPSVTAYTAYQTSKYAEVIVNYPITTHFMQVLPGFSSSQSVTARAIAGYENVSLGAGVLSLSSTGTGITVSGSSTLKVQGNVLADSTATTPGNAAVEVSGTSIIQAQSVNAAGNVDTTNPSAKVENLNGTTSPSPVTDAALPTGDPYIALPIPNSTNAPGLTSMGAVNTKGTLTLSPGIYTGIAISRSANVTFQPGIYIITGGGLSISGNATVTGSGVMIYNTGSDYVYSTGAPDTSDVATTDPLNQTTLSDASATFGGISVSNGTTVSLTPYSNSSSPFNGFLIYQRRANPQPITFSGNAAGTSGTIYAKWATVTVSNSVAETVGGQIIANKEVFSGNVPLTVNYSGASVGSAPRVFLVE